MRVFVYDGREFPDPDPNLKVDEVRQSMANFFPELSNAESKESKRGEDTIIEFKKRVGTKGGGPEEGGCRIGWCAKKKVHYGGGWNKDLEEGRCPICKANLKGD